MMSTVSEKLLQVAENVPKVYHAGQMNVVENAECLKGTISDTAMLLDDVSPVTHEMGVKVRGKNLFNKSIPYEDYTAGKGGYKSLSIYVGSGFSVTVSLLQKYDIGLGGYFYCVTAGSPQMWLYGNNNAGLCAKSVTMISKNGYISLNMTVEAYNNFKDEIMVEIGSTATAYTPYVPDLTTVTVSRYGKNLTNEKAVSPIVINEDGLIRYGWNLGILPQGNYTLSVYGNYSISKPISYKIITNGVYSNYVVLTNVAKPLTIALNGSQELIVYLFQGITELYDNVTLQLEKGVGTEYEPYIEPTSYPVAADGTVEGVTPIYPNTTLMTDTEGVIIDCNYYKDIDKAYNKLSAEIALSGGE